MSPQEIVTYGAGVIALSIVFGVFIARSRKDSSFDERAQMYMDDKDEMIHDLRKREDMYLTRTRELNDRLYELAVTHGTQVLAAVNQARQENHESVQRLHSRIEETNELLADTRGKLKHCEESHSRCESRLTDLEQRVMSVGA